MSLRHYWPRGVGVKANLDNVTNYDVFFFEGVPYAFLGFVCLFLLQFIKTHFPGATASPSIWSIDVSLAGAITI